MAERVIINNRYVLGALKKQGGMAELFVATDLDQDVRKVAVKLFRQEYTDNGVLREAFRRETQALKDLRHPRIVELLDCGFDERTNRHFLVLEWSEKDLA